MNEPKFFALPKPHFPATPALIAEALAAIPPAAVIDRKVIEPQLAQWIDHPIIALSGWITLAESCYASKPKHKSDSPKLLGMPGEPFLGFLIQIIQRHAVIMKRKQLSSAGWRWDALRGMIRKYRLPSKILDRIERFGGSLIAHALPSEMAEFRVHILAARSELGGISPEDFEKLKGAARGKPVNGKDHELLCEFASGSFKPPLEPEKWRLQSGQLKHYYQFVAEAATLDLQLQHLRWQKFMSEGNPSILANWVKSLGNKNLGAKLDERREWGWIISSFKEHELECKKHWARSKKARQRRKATLKRGQHE